MEAADFANTWRELLHERSEMLQRRNDLETELIELKKKISHLGEVIDHLAPLAGLAYANDQNISSLGLTDAIRAILKNSNERLAAQDVRQRLHDEGYDLSDLSAPMASIYKILRRLEDAHELDREKEDSRVYYRWKAGITDEDIPF